MISGHWPPFGSNHWLSDVTSDHHDITSDVDNSAFFDSFVGNKGMKWSLFCREQTILNEGLECSDLYTILLKKFSVHLTLVRILIFASLDILCVCLTL